MLPLPSRSHRCTGQLGRADGSQDHDLGRSCDALGSQAALCPSRHRRARVRSPRPGPSSLPRCSPQLGRYKQEARWGTAHRSRPVNSSASCPSGLLPARPLTGPRNAAASRLSVTEKLLQRTEVLPPVIQRIGFGMEVCRCRTANGQRLSCERAACGSSTSLTPLSPPALPVPGCCCSESSTASSAC